MPPPDLFGQRPLYVEPSTGAVSPSALALRPRGLDPGAAAAALAGVLDPARSLFAGVERQPLLPQPAAPPRHREKGRPATQGASDGFGLLAALDAALLGLASRGVVDLSLSGGLDSALLAALLDRAGCAGRAFTLAADYDESGEPDRAVGFARQLGFEPALVAARAEELPARFEDAVRAAEAPLWNGKAAASLLYFERCRAAGATRVLSGCGADDLLCGNPEALTGRDARAAAERALVQDLLLPGARALLPPSPRPAASWTQRRSRWIATVLPESTLVPECRLSAATGVEVRLPYLEPAFAASALAIDASELVRGGWGKWPLRREAERLLPRELCWQPKEPRLTPAGGGSPGARRAWNERLSAWLSRPRLRALELVDVRAVHELLERHAAGSLPEAARPAEAVLLRLASLTILQTEVDRRRGLPDARPDREE